MIQNPDESGSFASPPCFAHELESSDDDGAVSDAVQAADVARWRKRERERLINSRLAMPASERKEVARDVVAHLDRVIESTTETIVSLYWPFRGELNLRDWMHRLFEQGVRLALPVVVAKASPLIFREWTPESAMVPGVWKIPVPADGEILDPTVVISPLVGFDPARFRLGYGGGFYDRTLEAMFENGLRPRVIGVGYSCTELSTIYPQPHDIPMTEIITEKGIIAGPGNS